MARKSVPQPLTLADPPTVARDDFLDSPRSPLSPLSPKSPRSPRSPFKFVSSKKSQAVQQQQQQQQLQPPHPAHPPPPPQLEHPSMQTAEWRTTLASTETTTSLSSSVQPSSTAPAPPTHQERDRPARSGFFSNYKASKSSSRLQNAETTRKVSEDNMSRDTEGRPGVAGRVSSKERSRIVETSPDRSMKRRPVGAPKKSDTSVDVAADPPSSSSSSVKKHKPKPFNILNRTKSTRDELSPRAPSPNAKFLDIERAQPHNTSLRTAPLRSENDRSFRDMMSSNVRQRSEDRHATIARDHSTGREYKESRQQPSFSSSLRESGGHAFFNNLRSTATKGAGAISKGIFGKGGRSGSTNEKETSVADEDYVIKVLRKPLVDQTRITRISKKLEDSRDKTEFWMPAFPWRAIDYLNYKGSDVEGLYRVPGSTPEIKKWQRRFDEDLDVDLFEQQDLYDINIIGSMLKQWLRELPDELFPKASQDRVAREGSTSDSVPQVLIDELSNLPPFNYYLLFAITCHLSLLLAHSDKNKMDYRNLCICFQPCMKIDAYSFKFLVCDWRDCWKGCKTEAQYIEQENQFLEGIPPSSAEGRSSTAVESHDERNVSSSDSSKPSSVNVDKENQNWSQTKGERNLPLSQSQGSLSTIQSTTLTVVQDKTPPRRSNDMRPLSPIKPLSPIGL